MNNQMMSLEDQHILVFGGSAGIGLAVARQAHAQGARLTLVSSNSQRLIEALQLLPGACGHVLDLHQPEAAAALFTTLGRIDHLVYTAGDSLELHPLETLDMKQARSAFELRYWSALQVISLASNNLAPEGSIVLSSDTTGKYNRTFGGQIV